MKWLFPVVILTGYFTFLSLSTSAQIAPSYARKADSLWNLVSRAPGDSAAAAYLCQLAEIYKREESKKAINCLDSALGIARKLRAKALEAQALYQKGGIYLDNQELKNALGIFLQSLAISEELNNKDMIAANFNNIGLVYMRLNEPGTAIPQFKKGYDHAVQTADTLLMIQTSGNLAMCHKEMGDFQTAIERQSEIYELSMLRKDKVAIAYALNNIGDTYLSMGQKTKDMKSFLNAIVYFKRSLKVKKEIGNMRLMASTLGGIGSVYQQIGEYDSSALYLNRTVEIVEKLGVKTYQALAYYELAITYSLAGKHADAFRFMKKYALLKDSMSKEENSRQIAEMQTKYETEKKDKELLRKDAEIMLQKGEKEKQALQRNGFIIGFVLVLILAVFIFRGYKQKQKANLMITEQKMIVEEKQREILDSIRYAKRIQHAQMPSERYIDRNLKRLNKEE